MTTPAAVPSNSARQPSVASIRLARQVAVIQWGLLGGLFAVMAVVNYHRPWWYGVVNAVVGVAPAAVGSTVLASLSLRVFSVPPRSGRNVLRIVGHVVAGYVASAAWLGWLWLRLAVERSPAAAELFYDRWWTWQLHAAVWPLLVPCAVAHATRLSMEAWDRRDLLARAERARAQAELAFLRAHLGPHFLFNTLHTLGGLVHVAPDVADRRLQQLQEMLRYLVDREESGAGAPVRLEDEWVFVERYLALEADRLGERLDVHAIIDDRARDVMLPALLLQPLVENAIRHGISRRLSGGRVSIVARIVTSGHLELRVDDDGPGAEMLLIGEASGLGLRAVRQRIESMGNGASMQVDTTPGAGFRVRIVVPEVFRQHEPKAAGSRRGAAVRAAPAAST